MNEYESKVADLLDELEDLAWNRDCSNYKINDIRNKIMSLIEKIQVPAWMPLPEPYAGFLANLIEEVADVEIMLEQLKYLLGIHQRVERTKLYKTKRQLGRIKDEA